MSTFAMEYTNSDLDTQLIGVGTRGVCETRAAQYEKSFAADQEREATPLTFSSREFSLHASRTYRASGCQGQYTLTEWD